MDKIEKALKKLTSTEQENVKLILIKISVGRFHGLDIKKLKGRDDVYRVRKGVFRIIYRISSGKFFILAIERRRENTYKF